MRRGRGGGVEEVRERSGCKSLIALICNDRETCSGYLREGNPGLVERPHSWGCVMQKTPISRVSDREDAGSARQLLTADAPTPVEPTLCLSARSRAGGLCNFSWVAGQP
jgi:hypothetical protein